MLHNSRLYGIIWCRGMGKAEVYCWRGIENYYILPNLEKTVRERFDRNGESTVCSDREQDFPKCHQCRKRQVYTDKNWQIGRKIFLWIHVFSILSYRISAAEVILHNRIILMTPNLHFVWCTCEWHHTSKLKTLQITLHILCTIPKFYAHLDYLQNCTYIHKQAFT